MHGYENNIVPVLLSNIFRLSEQAYNLIRKMTKGKLLQSLYSSINLNFQLFSLFYKIIVVIAQLYLRPLD